MPAGDSAASKIFLESPKTCVAENIPNVISVDPGDKDLPLVVVDEQSSNHDGCFSVPVCHRETKCRLGKTERCSRVLQEGTTGRGKRRSRRRREGDGEVKAARSERVTISTGRHLSHTSVSSV